MWDIQPLIRIETLLVATLFFDGSYVQVGSVQIVAVAQSENPEHALVSQSISSLSAGTL